MDGRACVDECQHEWVAYELVCGCVWVHARACMYALVGGWGGTVAGKDSKYSAALWCMLCRTWKAIDSATILCAGNDRKTGHVGRARDARNARNKLDIDSGTLCYAEEERRFGGKHDG